MTILKVDIDKKDVNWFNLGFLLGQLDKEFLIGIEKIDIKESNKGYHFKVWTVADCLSDDTIFYQLVLGSDPQREIYNKCRVRANIPNWNRLFTKKTVYTGERALKYQSIEKDVEKEIIGSVINGVNKGRE